MDLIIIVAPALCMALLLSLIAAPIGALMIWRKMVFFSETFAHGGLLGMTLSVLWHEPFWVGTLITTLLILGMVHFFQHKWLSPDALLMLTSTTMISLSSIVIATHPSLQANLQGFLFGDILLVTWQDTLICGFIVITALALLIRNWQQQVKMSFSPILAQAEGISIETQKWLFTLILAAFTIFAVQAVGVVLTSALLVIPTISARLLAQFPRQAIVISFILMIFSIISGFVFSLWLNIPSGASIVVILAIMFVFIFLAKYLKETYVSQEHRTQHD